MLSNLDPLNASTVEAAGLENYFTNNKSINFYANRLNNFITLISVPTSTTTAAAATTATTTTAAAARSVSCQWNRQWGGHS